MNCKKISLTAVAALLLACAPALTFAQTSAPAPAQDQAAPAQKAERPSLNLTDDQKAQMKKIHEDAKSQIAAVQTDSSLSADQKQQKVQQIHRDAHKQVMAMLTPDQRKTMREWRHEHKAEHEQQQQPPAS
jgi:Spy/CpxP family protein refolding chaperone